jgi:hypothetical protein
MFGVCWIRVAGHMDNFLGFCEDEHEHSGFIKAVATATVTRLPSSLMVYIDHCCSHRISA